MVSNPDFEVGAVDAAGLLKLTLRNLWTLQTVDAFAAAMHASTRTAQAQGRKMRRILADAREHGPQPQDVVIALQQKMPKPEEGEKVAIVVGGALHRMQIARTQPAGRIATFASMAEAEQWLAES